MIINGVECELDNTLLFKLKTSILSKRDVINSNKMRGLYANINQKSWRELTHWR